MKTAELFDLTWEYFPPSILVRVGKIPMLSEAKRE